MSIGIPGTMLCNKLAIERMLIVNLLLRQLRAVFGVM